MASVDVPHVLIYFSALCIAHILDRVDENNRRLLAFEYELDLLRKGMADWLMLDFAMIATKVERGHT